MLKSFLSDFFAGSLFETETVSFFVVVFGGSTFVATVSGFTIGFFFFIQRFFQRFKFGLHRLNL